MKLNVELLPNTREPQCPQALIENLQNKIANIEAYSFPGPSEAFTKDIETKG